jgi:hypothetical protein
MRRAQYKSAGVLPPGSGVARKIAISKIKKKGSNRRPPNQANQEVNSQSDTGPFFSINLNDSLSQIVSPESN